MSEPLRTDPSHATDAASERDRDAKIEQLLVLGLDHYFSAEYEQAINVWSRALFLDRSHARARAYIERARSAVAERQRESEELMQNGVAAFNRGEADHARRLLKAAIHKGAPHDEALALLDRLSRLDQGTTASRPEGAIADEGSALAPVVNDLRRSAPWALIVSAVVVVLLVAGGVLATRAIDWRSLGVLEPPQNSSPTTSSAPGSGLPLPLRAETALERARGLQAGGRLRDALTMLDVVRPTDAQKADADRLRATIQRQLLSLAAIDPLPASRKGEGPIP